jgi:hypothetical protein
MSFMFCYIKTECTQLPSSSCTSDHVRSSEVLSCLCLALPALVPEMPSLFADGYTEFHSHHSGNKDCFPVFVNGYKNATRLHCVLVVTPNYDLMSRCVAPASCGLDRSLTATSCPKRAPPLLGFDSKHPRFCVVPCWNLSPPTFGTQGSIPLH